MVVAFQLVEIIRSPVIEDHFSFLSSDFNFTASGQGSQGVLFLRLTKPAYPAILAFTRLFRKSQDNLSKWLYEN